MPTNVKRRTNPDDFDRLRRLHARVIRDSVTLVHRIDPADLTRQTPCEGWTLLDLLAHMTAQHHGFAAAARGDGGDPGRWEVRPAGRDAPERYGEAAELVVAAFAAVGSPDRAFDLPEFSRHRTFRAERAVGFHLVDYVVHGWDVARSLDLAWAPGSDVLAVTLPIAEAVPGGEARKAPGSPFGPELQPAAGADPLDRILATLGRPAGWRPC
ncbi:TIGR03086 family metal-binding protein [Streptomyces sp. NBC_00572]|uniref:TIGR03086 family metal-binding protein n=1 Tax=Streptomyces sp. NBC_00572 TaxID=2903664 RepID=UPI00225C0653|nr:TIGR03086 family metal-binding protein [Streptomyces sp. NBC_00572]MCX4983071.1 TIGR03086 family metal-binding protein [Streptomyces sp. NBC_00572]